MPLLPLPLPSTSEASPCNVDSELLHAPDSGPMPLLGLNELFRNWVRPTSRDGESLGEPEPLTEVLLGTSTAGSSSRPEMRRLARGRRVELMAGLRRGEELEASMTGAARAAARGRERPYSSRLNMGASADSRGLEKCLLYKMVLVWPWVSIGVGRTRGSLQRHRLRHARAFS
jgi:hypothetical protein